ncbi:amino acid permease [Haloarchaeobius baliensis]|uniref:amino acid permease n=1 Tax=Haloarchaeobius baliensis TaxID=1670458 RepID=UPI003F8842F8
MRGWACKRCAEIHTQNPNECRNCGHGIFRPVSKSELSERSTGGDTPEPFTPTYTVGSAPDEEVEKSPDVNLDGSINRPDEEDDPNAQKQEGGLLARLLRWFRS